MTFADLMGLLMSFFVMLVAFSTQDKQKLQIVAGSMRDAFGVQQVRFNGIIETDGLPTKPTLKNVARISPEEASNTPGPNEPERQKEGMQTKEDRAFALAAASLRQAMQEHAGNLRALQAHHDRGEPERTEHRARSTRTAVRCSPTAPRSPTSGPAASSRSSPAP